MKTKKNTNVSWAQCHRREMCRLGLYLTSQACTSLEPELKQENN
jgi:hypothetical protein